MGFFEIYVTQVQKMIMISRMHSRARMTLIGSKNTLILQQNWGFLLSLTSNLKKQKSKNDPMSGFYCKIFAVKNPN